MGPLPLSLLIGTAATLSITAIYFVWARKLPKK
jgi:hypothetical protein